MKNGIRKLGALCLALFLCAACAGCLPLLYWIGAEAPEATGTALRDEWAWESTPPTPEAWSPSPKPPRFSEIEYLRPDGEGLLTRMASLTGQVPRCEDYAALDALIVEFEAIYLHVDTQDTLVSLYAEFKDDTERWDREGEYLRGLYEDVIEAKYAFVEAILASPLAEQAHRERPGYSKGWEYVYHHDEADRLLDARLQDLYRQEEEWMEAYMDAMEDTHIVYQGRSVNYQAVMDMEDEAYDEAFDLWLEAVYPRLIECYAQLVILRADIASLEGYADYAQMVFAQEGRDYTPDQARRLLGDIREILLPVIAQWNGYGYYLPDISMDFDRFSAGAGPILTRMSPSLGEVFTLMVDSGFYNVEPTPQKGEDAYMTYLLEYSMPFISMGYRGDAWSVSTLLHEFGHFYEAYSTQEKSSSVHDVSEIHSQALVLLFSSHYQELAAELGPALEYDEILNALDSTVYLSFTPAIELAVYALDRDQVTPDTIGAIAHGLTRAYGYDGVSDAHDRCAWILEEELISLPTRSLSYVTALTVALELWEMGLEDQGAAIDAYEALVACDVDTLEGATRAAGLALPFQAGRCARIAAALEDFFQNERWQSYDQIYFGQDD